MNKTAEALESLQKAVAVQPSYAAAHNSLGEFFVYAKRDPAAARKHFLDALHVDPDYAPSLANMGTLEMTVGNYAEAARYMLRVIALNPKFIPAYGNLALLYSAQGRTAEARSFLALALKIDPHNERIKDLMTKIAAPGQSGTKHKNTP
jgi:tetratricopeptide (TPR) repeat protein